MSEIIVKALNDVYDGPLTSERFRSWKREVDVRPLGLADYAIGRITWPKRIGRPETATLSEGFVLTAFNEQWIRVPVSPTAFQWERWAAPRTVSWWDAPGDEASWSIAFIVGGLTDGHLGDPRKDLYSGVIPALRDVRWTPPLQFAVSLPGLRTLSPPSAIFIKGPTTVYLHFEVKLLPPWSFDDDGVGAPSP